MNKSELVEKVAIGADITKASANRAVDAILKTVTGELANGGEVALVGFGAFKVNDRAARKGRNPQTGAEIQIAAVKVPTFKTGKGFKGVING